MSEYAFTIRVARYVVVIWQTEIAKFQVAGAHEDLRPYAFNPSTAVAFGAAVMRAKKTGMIPFLFGVIGAIVLLIWMIYRTFAAMSFVHNIGGWYQAVAIVVALLAFSALGRLQNSILSLIIGSPKTTSDAMTQG